MLKGHCPGFDQWLPALASHAALENSHLDFWDLNTHALPFSLFLITCFSTEVQMKDECERGALRVLWCFGIRKWEINNIHFYIFGNYLGLKGFFTLKWKFRHRLLTLISFLTVLLWQTFFCWTQNKIFWKSLGSKLHLSSSTFIICTKKNIIQNIFSYIMLQKKECHWNDTWSMMTSKRTQNYDDVDLCLKTLDSEVWRVKSPLFI